MLPSGLGAPTGDPAVPSSSTDPAVRWLQPVPDARVVVLTAGTAGIARITAFADPDLVTAFGFPAVAPGYGTDLPHAR